MAGEGPCALRGNQEALVSQSKMKICSMKNEDLFDRK